MTSRFISPFYDVGSGIKPSSGSKLFFFKTDGVTPKDTFSDEVGTTPNTNPVISDSNGVFSDIYISGDYKVTLKDKNDSLKFSLAEVSELSSGNFDTNLINDLSQTYEFATVALYKAFTTAFPVGKTIKLLDRGAEFTVITGTGTATEYKIIASTEVSQSIDLIITNGISLAAFGVDLTGVTDSTLALQAVADTRLADGVVLAPWTGSITLSDTVQFREVGVDFIGSGMETATLTMTDNTKFALDFFAISSGKGTFKAGDFKIVAKYGIFTRWDLATDFENTANPIKKYDFERINCVGEYANTTDPLAGGVLVPTWSELTALGVGIHIAMNYRTTVKDCEFSFYGIGLNSIGSTLCEFSHNRFINNARNLHEERTKWVGSAFGLGADNIISQNDFLDATRIGGTTFINTFGNKFINNYTEHLDRGGQLSTATLLYLVNASHTTVRDNHFNPNLSVVGSNPYIKILQDGNWIGEASNNRIHGNKLTPQANLENAIIQTTITEYDARYPAAYYFYDNADFNRLDIQHIIDQGSIDKARLSFDNLDDLTTLGGNVSTNTLIFTKDVTLNSWHLPSTEPGAGTASLTFKLYLENYDLSNNFEFVITADDNATGNGRLDLNIQDETGFVYNATAFTGITSITTTVVPFTGGREANKVFDVNFTNMAFSKVYNFYIRAV